MFKFKENCDVFIKYDPVTKVSCYFDPLTEVTVRLFRFENWVIYIYFSRSIVRIGVTLQQRLSLLLLFRQQQLLKIQVRSGTKNIT